MRVNIDKAGNITITDFSPVQAYKIAVRMEKDGIDFYSDLLKQVRDAGTQHEIEFLIEQEKAHLDTFQGLLNRVKETANDTFEEDDIVDYIKSRVFNAALEKEEAQKMEHRHTALEEAMNMERRSIVFYDGCLARSKDGDAKSAFKKILDEERKHLTKFAELLRIKCIDSGEGCIL
ncbi:MAG: ferritin family protein [Candidatus Omnitrophica bacterium]|nr:ferritin family protein [Candidatus Omnitrophota bacterium]